MFRENLGLLTFLVGLFESGSILHFGKVLIKKLWF